MEYTYIYSLSDPMTGEIRYIGKTYNELKKRLYSHIMECKTDRKTHKINWIKSLLSNNKKPIISTIDIVPKSDWEYWEKYWIEQFKQWGFNLTNMTMGGYDNNSRLGKEKKQKIRVSKLRTTSSDEHTYNMRKIVKDTEYYLDKFISKAAARHSGKYDYSRVNYVNSIEKVEVVCPEHGPFFVRPDAHVRKVGCPKCNGGGKDSIEDFIGKANRKHEGKYDYSKSEYVNSGTKIEVGCGVAGHGTFRITPRNHLAGQGCPKCGGVYRRTEQEFVGECRAVHGDRYDYSMTSYTGMGCRITVACPDHGVFSQSAKDHLRGHGCPKCSSSKGERLIAGILEKLGIEFEEGRSFDGCKGHSGGILPFDFYIPSKKIAIEFDGRQHFGPVEAFGGKEAYEAQVRNDAIRDEWCARNGIRMVRIKHDEVERCLDALYSELVGEVVARDCRMEASRFSLKSFLAARDEMVSFVSGFGGSVQRHSVDGFACDVFAESAGIGFRMLGHWKDCEINADRKSACMAQAAYERRGYKIVHIYEDTWMEKKEIVKSRIGNMLGKNRKVWARKCELKPVGTREAGEFVRDSHIQGNVGSSYKIGLYSEGALVALMTFGPLRKNLGQKSREKCWELLRFCTGRGTSVIGGASRLFRHFLKEKDPDFVVSYADKCWSTKDNIYGELGMEYVHESKPSYFYIVGGARKGRFGYRKDVLVKMGFDARMSEHEICKSNGVWRIYDCGAIKYAYEKSGRK